MVVVSHLSLFLGNKFRSRCDSCDSHLLLFKTIYFPIAPFFCKKPHGEQPEDKKNLLEWPVPV